MTPAQILRALRSAARHAGAQVDLVTEQVGQVLSVRINWISSSSPGAGAEALRRLCQAADENGVDLRVQQDQADSEKLRSLFGRHDFEVTPGGAGDLIRTPSARRSSPMKETGRTQALDDWISGSTVVDPQGEPLVLYHGTTAEVSDFDLSFSGSDGIRYALPAVFATTDPELASEYALNKFNRNIADAMRALQRHKNLKPGDYGPEYEACYQAVRAALSDAREVGEYGGGANVMPVLMSLRNPLRLDAAGKHAMDVLPQAIPQAAAEGRDGLIVLNLVDRASDSSTQPADVYIALNPSRVKSAIAYRGRLSAQTQGVMYSFAGQTSKTAQMDRLAQARTMLAAGVDSEQVRVQTGWSMGLDGQPRYEISDHLAFLKGSGTFGEIVMRRRAALATQGPTYLPDVLYHPELFEAYPSLREIEVQFIPSGINANARVGGDVFIEVRESLPADRALSCLLHEVQHLIQTVERFAPGGSPGEAFADLGGVESPGLVAAHDIFRSLLLEVIRPHSIESFAANVHGVTQITEDVRISYQQYLVEHARYSTSPGASADVEQRAARQWYRRLAGEIEARNVQARLHFSAEARVAVSPSVTSDVAPEDAIVLAAGSRRSQSQSVVPRVFHGTSQDFEAFAPNERGLFFAEDRSRASAYVSVRRGPCARVIEAELNIVRPWTYIYYGLDVPMRDMLDQSTQALKAQGYDGVYMAKERVWVAFEPDQVRVVAIHRVDDSRRHVATREPRAGLALDTARFSHSEGTGDITRPFDFSTDARFRHLFYGQPTPQEIRAFSSWLRSRPNDFVRLYHGTAAVNPIHGEGILPATSSRRNSLQSASGYVCLSVFPGLARGFGGFACLNKPAASDGARVAVYPVTRTIRSLLADLDQLRNRRLFGGEHIGCSLAESLVHGHGARVRGRVDVTSIGPSLRYRARSDQPIAESDAPLDQSRLQPGEPSAGRLREGEKALALFSFAGEGSASANLGSLRATQQAIHANASPESERVRTGWFKGPDQRWRYEIDDSGAHVLPALKSLDRGGYPACTIASVTYRVLDGDRFDICLNPPNPQRTNDFQHFHSVSREVVKALMPSEVLALMDRGVGDEDFIGNFEEARRLVYPFEFGGMNAMPLDQALHHPVLFDAYPSLRSLSVQVLPELGVGACLATLDDGTHVLRVGRAHQLSNMMHEIQHAIQTIEGFALGGSPDVFRERQASALPIEIVNEALTIAELSQRSGQSVHSIRQRPPKVLRAVSDVAWQLASIRSLASLRTEFSFTLTSLSPLESYMRLAGEVEARNVQSRLRFDVAQRRAVAPRETADRSDDDVLIDVAARER